MPHDAELDPEAARLAEDAGRTRNWKRWGPYLSERQWATVREDYSPDGDCWNYFPHDHARSRAYRWGEDGLLGICDRECRLCFAIALWNGRDSILKERLFGLTNSEGNHGEDVKEAYFYLDATPTGSYLKALYKYPQGEFPYQRLNEENARRSRSDREFELANAGAFDGGRYFDVTAEYAKASPDDILIRLTIANRGPDTAGLHLLPTLWYRNAWTWGCTHEGCSIKPRIERADASSVVADHPTLGKFRLSAEPDASLSTVLGGEGRGEGPSVEDASTSRNGHRPVDWIFTDNETNFERIFNSPNSTPYVKDAFHEYVVHGRTDAVDPRHFGTKAAAHYKLTIPPGGEVVVRLRFCPDDQSPPHPFGPSFDATFHDRIAEADAFYARRLPAGLDAEQRRVARQAFAGLLWSKQFYHYVIRDWLDGDPNEPTPPPQRKAGRNADWGHLFNRDVVSMPDKWEYPWYACWDLAFHMVPMAYVDPQFAKDQLLLFLREWYMHPSGALPAYEFALGDVNPPVHAWACWRVYKITGRRGRRDRGFLQRCFHKLLLNFTWWVNRKDVHGRHIFAGGFLGMDNIGLFDRNMPLDDGQYLDQADGTAWMAFFCGTMLSIALELARDDPAYEDVASKFFEHFVAISDAMNNLGGTGLWDETDGFYYDQLCAPDHVIPLRIRSMVGIVPLFACEVLNDAAIDRLPGFRKRMRWFLDNRKDLARHISYMEHSDHCPLDVNADGEDPAHAHANGGGRYLLAIPSRERLLRVLRYVLDEAELLSPHGVRSLSRHHLDHPHVCDACGQEYRAQYTPAESTTGVFGGNSNWRGPIWFPVNFLLIEALQRYHHYYGDTLKVEHPTGSGRMLNLAEVAAELQQRLTSLFLPDGSGRRPCNGDDPLFDDRHFRDHVLFHEYFDGDTGRGLGASHQTGWTALVAPMLRDVGRRAGRAEAPAGERPATGAPPNTNPLLAR